MVELKFIAEELFSNLRFEEALDNTKPLILFMAGIIVYAIFIFKFYRFVAKRDILKLNLKQYSTSDHPTLQKTIAFILYVVEYIIIMPIIIFFWFAVLSAIIIFFSKEADPQRILIVTFSLVGAIRAISYYSEDLSKDLAKMLPFALLGVFLVDITYFSWHNSVSILAQMPSMWKIVLYYLIFIVVLESVFRMLLFIIKPILPKTEEEKAEELKKVPLLRSLDY